MTASLKARGVEVHTDCEITAARRDGDEVVATTSHGDLRGDELLVAVGRRARTRDIGIDTVGLEPGRYLDVDDTMQVRGPAVALRRRRRQRPAQLTHMGKYQARQAGAAIVARARGEQVSHRGLVAVRRHRGPTARRRRSCSPCRRSPASG